MSGHSVRFRRHSAVAVAAVVVALSMQSLAAVSWYLALLSLGPVAVAVWAWRSGTDADRLGLRLRAALGQRRIPWSEVAELGPDGRGGAAARLRDGRVVSLPAVRAADLPELVAASGQPLAGAPPAPSAAA
ncbi:MAG TPA: PH domain-containing protein [Pilimelia sp.]|nr:PH domain-containing protein [Pilimelia sp.]